MGREGETGVGLLGFLLVLYHTWEDISMTFVLQYKSMKKLAALTVSWCQYSFPNFKSESNRIFLISY